MNKHVQLLFVTLLLVMPLLVFPNVVKAEPTIPNEYLPQWEVNVNLTIYIPDDTTTTAATAFSSLVDLATSKLAVIDSPPMTPLSSKLDLVNEYYLQYGIPARIFKDTEKNLYGISVIVSLSSDTTANNNTVDILPDVVVQEEATIDPLRYMGSQVKYYENKTDFSGDVTFDVTDYQGSQYPYLLFNDFKAKTAGPTTVEVTWSNATGNLYGTTSVLLNMTDLLIARDWWLKLPSPVNANYPYVAKVTVKNAVFTNFVIADYAADYDMDVDMSFQESLIGLSSTSWIPSSIATAMAKIPTQKAQVTTAVHAVGFTDLRSSTLSAAAKKAGISKDAIVTHVVNEYNEKIQVPKQLSADAYDEMKNAYDQGEKSAIQLRTAGERKLKAVTVGVGLKAEEIKTGVAESGKDLTGNILSAIASKEGKQIIGAISNATSSLWKMSPLGQIQSMSAALMSNLDPSIMSGAKSSLIWIVAIVIGVLVLILVIKLA